MSSWIAAGVLGAVGCDPGSEGAQGEMANAAGAIGQTEAGGTSANTGVGGNGMAGGNDASSGNGGFSGVDSSVSGAGGLSACEEPVGSWSAACPAEPPQRDPSVLCSRGAICNYVVGDFCLLTFCSSEGRQWEPSSGECVYFMAEGEWPAGPRWLAFSETEGTCGALGHMGYRADDDHQLGEYECELIERAVDDCSVHEALECEHQTVVAQLSLDLMLHWSENARAWFGQASATIQSDEFAIDCASTYNVRAD